jgi:hypothetical protein
MKYNEYQYRYMALETLNFCHESEEEFSLRRYLLTILFGARCFGPGIEPSTVPSSPQDKKQKILI